MSSVYYQEGFSDDDLDALPDGAFQELQEHAIISTQQAARERRTLIPSASRPPNKIPALVAQSLGRLSVTKNVPVSPSQGGDFPNQPSSDYGDLDDDMLDGEIYDAAEEPGVNAIQVSRAASLPYGEPTQREQWRNHTYGIPPRHLLSDNTQPPAKPQGCNESKGKYPSPGGSQEFVEDGDAAHPTRQPDVDSLNAQIEEVRSPRSLGLVGANIS